jgi:hypothetical protein
MEDAYKMSDKSKCSVLKQFLPSQQSSGPLSVTTAYHMSSLTANLYSDTRSATNKQRGRMELLICFPGDSQNLVQNAGNVKCKVNACLHRNYQPECLENGR